VDNYGVKLALVASIALIACAGPQPAPSPAACAVTPISEKLVGGGHTVSGKGDRDIFIYPFLAGTEKHTEATGPEKMLVFLAHPTDPPSMSITVQGVNLTTGTRRTFRPGLQYSEFGTAWGTNYFFPDAGCWHLSVDVAGNAGLVTIEVR
jgi:hypothetical protein